MRVLVVDDSVVFRSQISAALGGIPGVVVAGTAPNGSIALQKLSQLSVDLVTLDVEMPDQDGIQVLKEIRKAGFPVRVIMFSSQTSRGADKTLEALVSGADDFVAKPGGAGLTPENAPEVIRQALMPKVMQFMRESGAGASGFQGETAPTSASGSLFSVPSVSTSQVETRRPFATSQAPATVSQSRSVMLETFIPDVIVIASSTGGPAALDLVFSQIQGPVGVPILIAQHMPPVFTASLAKRLGDVTGIPSREAKNGEVLSANQIYVAPGDFHLSIEGIWPGIVKTKLDQAPQRNSVRPAADYLFEAAAKVFGRKCMGVVLTGMGEDGCVGAQAIKDAGGAIMIQNQESCVVFGMPGAVHRLGLFDGQGTPAEIGGCLKRMAWRNGKGG